MRQQRQGQGFLLTANSYDRQGRACIQLWLASDNGPIRLEVNDQQPVFFVLSEELPQVQDVLGSALAKHQQLELNTFQHQAISACYFASIDEHYNAAQQLRQAGLHCFESDIKLHERFLTERFCYGSMAFAGEQSTNPQYPAVQQAKIKTAQYTPTLSVLSLDIECSEKGQLYSIGLYSVNYQRVLMIGPEQAADTPITWLANEYALLKQLELEFQSIDPDIIIGWNVINFDFRLLVKRAALHGLKLAIGREQGAARWRERSDNEHTGFISIPGRVVVDGIDSLKSATYQFDSFSLENVAQQLLNRGKLVDEVHDRMAEINHNFAHNKPQLAAYNLEDCKLVLDIFKHTQILEYLCLRSQLTGLMLDRSGGSVAAFTNVYLPKLHRAGYVAPNLTRDFVADSPGGYVMNSKPGLYKNVLVLDFKSLYPSIIRTFKIDPLGLIEGLAKPDTAIEGFRGGVFSRDKHFLPEIINQLWLQRDQAKADKDSARSQAIKILMNSFYGVLGSTGCRFHDPRLASSITMRGHQLMQETADWIIKQGHEVIYGDTDSTFVWLNQEVNPEQAKQIGQQLAEGINQYWQQKLANEMQLDSHLEIEFETHFSRFLMPTIRGSETGSKKRYAGLTAQNQMVIKGLETVRSDWTEMAKIFQTGLLERLFADQDPRQFVLDTVEQLMAGDFDQQLIYRKRLRRKLAEYVKNVPPQVRAARLADEHNKALGKALQYQNKGSIAYWMTINGPEPITNRINQIDYQHYLDKQLQPIADGILPFINLDFEQITSAQLGLF
ncbi:MULTISPECIES: DNA polymerase II [unclassified Agarivorans]|uniref:DNA polymerase II n=1 Tax=unclassified Agarivorans TaxID=2636026 RepID=UPI0026E38DE9|nr:MULTISPECIES: DNA polymerase II [unclassified Agarivorans]MDO6685805.1 DNA polymerase II [Agarivorans sp. 3_MG-2023]MDO6716080.1 DNA polymerase II [Agarivorans sp. 2_MG-2023]